MFNVFIRDGFDKMDFEKVTEMLSNAYWSPKIGVDEVKKGAANSALVIGAFTQEGKQVGYARVSLTKRDLPILPTFTLMRTSGRKVSDRK